jgi:ribosomal protein S21
MTDIHLYHYYPKQTSERFKKKVEIRNRVFAFNKGKGYPTT